MIDRTPLAPLLALTALALAACATEAPAAEDRLAAPAASQPVGALRPYVEPVTRVRFPFLAEGVTVEAEHHDPSLPAKKFRHTIHLRTASGPAVIINVWHNPSALPLRAWFDAHLAFLVGPSTRLHERPMARARVPGILLREPRSPQALSQAVGVFASGDQVFRVTCLDEEGNADNRRIFERVIEDLETGVTP